MSSTEYMIYCLWKAGLMTLTVVSITIILEYVAEFLRIRIEKIRYHLKECKRGKK